MQKSAPSVFAPSVTPKKDLKLIIEGDSFHWQMLLPIQSLKPRSGDTALGQDSGDLIDPKEISNYKFEELIDKISIYRWKKTDAELLKQSSGL